MPRTTVPTYEEFATRAKEIAAAIPAEFMDGVEDVAIHRGGKAHPLLGDVMTLGECEPSIARLTDTGIVRSIVHLYYGSFKSLARTDPGFDVDAELRETIEHEIQHHIEDRAGVRALEDEDDLFDAHQRFRAGLSSPPGWWRRGERLEDDVYAVEDDLFVELRLRRADFEARRGTTVTLDVLGEPFEADVPKDAVPGRILSFPGEGLADDDADAQDEPGAGDLHLVLVVR
jgi:hypothetical protein